MNANRSTEHMVSMMNVKGDTMSNFGTYFVFVLILCLFVPSLKNEYCVCMEG
jgi:hypothetical protein